MSEVEGLSVKAHRKTLEREQTQNSSSLRKAVLSGETTLSNDVTSRVSLLKRKRTDVRVSSKITGGTFWCTLLHSIGPILESFTHGSILKLRFISPISVLFKGSNDCTFLQINRSHKRNF